MVVILSRICVLFLICAEIVSATVMVQPPDLISKMTTVPHIENQTLDKRTTLSPVTLPSVTEAPTNVSKEPPHINHNITDVKHEDVVTSPVSPTPTVPLTHSSVSSVSAEVSDMTSHHSYTGGSDVDEIGKGQHIEHPVKEESKMKNVSSNNTEGHISLPREGKSITTSTAAGIVAFVCVGIASIACASLVTWRYVYRKRHGNREILINEEDLDFNDEDLRHFEATSIQLEPEA